MDLSEPSTPSIAGRQDLLSAAQARRDRARLLAAQAEIRALQRRLAEFERSPVQRTLRLVRGLVAGRDRRAHTPSGRSASTETVSGQALQEQGRGFALVIDDHWPQPDRDAGSLEIVTLMQALRRLGFKAVLAAGKQHGAEELVRQLQALGIDCLHPKDTPSLKKFIVKHGATIDLCVLCRAFAGGSYLEIVEQHCRGARLVFNSIDLNFLREERRARLVGDAAMLQAALDARGREEHVIRSCDATIVVSQAEAELLATEMPERLTVQLPLSRPLRPPQTAFEARHGIGFIGNFSHAPNVDAVQEFLAKIWPLVHRDLSGCSLSIVGPNASPDLLRGATGDVTLLGHVPDIGPWFESLRLTVAPLRFGAGAKGKIASSLAAGVPCIVTPMAAEGMSLAQEAGVLIADSPEAFAAAIERAYGDEELWQRLSTNGLAYAASTLSPSAWQRRLDEMLRRIGV